MAEKNATKPVISAYDGGEKRKAVTLFKALTAKQKDTLTEARPDIAAFAVSYKR